MRGSAQIDAGSLQAAVLVGDTLVPVLAPIAVVLLLALASRDELAVAGTGLAVLLALDNVHICTGPEQVVATPLVSLPRQSDAAVRTGEVLWQRYLVLLSTAKGDRLESTGALSLRIG